MDTKELYAFLVKNHDELHVCIDKVENQCDERYKDTSDKGATRDNRLAVIERRIDDTKDEKERFSEFCKKCKSDTEKKIKESLIQSRFLNIVGGALIILNSLAMAILLIWIRASAMKP
jgi:hypothetical protein